MSYGSSRRSKRWAPDPREVVEQAAFEAGLSVEELMDSLAEDERPLVTARRRAERRPLRSFDQPDYSEDRVARIVGDALEQIHGTMRSNEQRTAAALDLLSRRMAGNGQDNVRSAPRAGTPSSRLPLRRGESPATQKGIRDIYDELERRLGQGEPGPQDDEDDGGDDESIADLMEYGARVIQPSARQREKARKDGREESRRFREVLESTGQTLRAEQTAPPSEALNAELLKALRLVDGKISKLDRTTGPDQRAIATLTAEMGALRRAVTSQGAGGDATAIERQLATVAARIDGLSAKIGRDASSAQPQASAEMIHAVKALENKLDLITRSAAEPIQRVTAALGRLSEREAPPSHAPEIIEMLRKLDIKLGQQVQVDTSPAVQSVLREVKQLRASLDTETVSPQISTKLDALNERVETLTEKLLAIRASAGGPRDLRPQKPLDAEFEEVKRLIRTSLSPCDDTRVLEAIEALNGKLSSLGEAPNALLERLERIHDLMNERPTGGLPPNVELLLRDLAGRLESVQALPVDEQSISRLQEDIREIGRKVDAASEAHAAPRENLPIERAVHDLVQGLDHIRLGVEATAEKAARQAAAEVVRELSVRKETPELTELRQSVATIMAMQQDNGTRTSDTLAAVHDTLQKVVDRLIDMEREARTPAPQPAFQPPMMGYAAPAMPGHYAAPDFRMETPLAPSPVPPVVQVQAPELDLRTDLSSKAAEPAAPRSQISAAIAAARAAVAGSRLGRSETDKAAAPRDHDPILLAEPNAAPQRSASLDLDMPLEPGMGRPDPAASPQRLQIDRLQADRLQIDRLQADRMPLDRPAALDPKAEFIAAARRAAQAAAAQSGDALRAGQAQAKSKGKGFSLPLMGEGSNLKAKHAILLGLAALVVAVGAVSQFTGSSKTTTAVEPPARSSALTAPRVQQQAATEPRAAAPVARDATRDVAVQPLPAPVSSPQTTTEARGTVRTAASPADEPVTVGAINPRGTVAAPPTNRAILTADDPLLKFEGIKDADGLKQSARRGDLAAMVEVGARYLDGRGAPRDPKLASQWFEKAADAGSPAAQYRLGALYREGRGVPRDAKQALRYFQTSAEGGNIRGMHNTAVLLAEGVNGAPDYAQAGEWFKKASEHGIRDSQYNLAILYARGLGVSQDLMASYAWFAAAATQGDEDAGKKRDEVGSRLSPEKLTQARAAANAWKAKPADPVANEAAQAPLTSSLPTMARPQTAAPRAATPNRT